MRSIPRPDSRRAAFAVFFCLLFTLLAPLSASAAPDLYESDDVSADAKELPLDASIQSHTIDPESEYDWVTIDVEAGDAYEFATSNLTGGLDTIMWLYDTDGETILDVNDDTYGMNPRIARAFPDAGIYYLSISGYTGATGDYQLTGLSTDNYKVRFFDPSGAHIPEYYENSALWATALDVAVVTGADTASIDAELSPAAHIAGRVEDLTGDGIAGIAGIASADALTLTPPLTETADAVLSENGKVSGIVSAEEGGALLPGITVAATLVLGGPAVSDQTDSGGRYLIQGLNDGDYRLRFSDSSGAFVSEYWENATDLVSATPVTVTDDVLTGRDAQLATAGHITETVTSLAGSPLAGIAVEVYDETNAAVEFETTTGDGGYSVGGLPSGDYRLLFRDDANSLYRPEYWNNQTSLASADAVAVTDGANVTGISPQLRPFTAISGHVYGAGGAGALANMSVTWLTTADAWSGYDTTTGFSGAYAVRGMPRGDYLVYFSDPDLFPVYRNEYYQAKSMSADAYVMTVTEDTAITDIDATLGVLDGLQGGFTIEGSAQFTRDAAVSVDSSVTGATEMRFSNDGVFDDVTGDEAWMPYSAQESWALPLGEGTKTVHAEYRDAGTGGLLLQDTVILDNTAPTVVTLDVADSAYSTNDQTPSVDITVDDGSGSGPDQMRLSNDGVFDDVTGDEAWQDFVSGAPWDVGAGDGEKNVWVQVKDGTGLTSDAVRDGVVLDTEAPGPVLDIVYADPPGLPDADPGWFVATPDVTLSSDGTDDSLQYQWDGTDDGGWQSYGSFIEPLSGAHQVYGRALDPAGNTSVVLSSDVNVDTGEPVDPVLTSAHTAGTPSSDNTVTVSWSGASDPESGVDGFSYVFNQDWGTEADTTKDAEQGSTSFTSPPLADGTWYFHLRTKDNAGNWTNGAVQFGPIQIDTDAPSTSITLLPASPNGSSGWYVSTPDITLASDESGTTRYQWDSTGVAWSTYSGPFAATAGTHTLYYRSIDTGGATEAVRSKLIKVDTVAPSIALASTAKAAGSYVRRTISFPVAASDALSLMNKVSLLDGATLKGSDLTLPYAPALDTRTIGNGKHTFTLRAYDKAGNTRSVSRSYKVDNYRPVTYAPKTATVKKGAKVRLYYKIKDPYTGTAYTTIRVKNSAGKTVKTIKAGWKKPGVQRYVTYTVKVKRGAYRMYVYAKDKAGNLQKNKASNKLTVK